MSARRFAGGWAPILCVLAMGCDNLPTGPAPAPSASSTGQDISPQKKLSYFARVIPRSATPLHAPPNVFRLKGWNSRSNWIKLVDIVPDGTSVKAGDEVARFEFSSEDARAWLDQRIAETQADYESAVQRVSDERRREEARAEVLRLEAERAHLDMGKQGLVSDRDLALLGVAERSAEAERDAQIELAKATRARGSSELNYLSATAEDWKSGILRYEMYARRCKVLAPHAGVVRHAYLNHLRRKVQKADNMPSGALFVHVAEDDRLSVEVLVPEVGVGGIQVGQTLRARLPDDAARYDITVRTINDYPQEVGFLRGDDELPDAREKVYLVTADFDKAPAAMKSGMEVRVEPW